MIFGELAQLARAPALHAGGQGFDSLILHRFIKYFRSLYTEFWKLAQWQSVLTNFCQEDNGSIPDIFTIPDYREKFFDMLEE